jgi:HEAT repeat protein
MVGRRNARRALPSVGHVNSAFAEAPSPNELQTIALDASRSSIARSWALWTLRQTSDRQLRSKLPRLLAARPADGRFLWEVAKTIVVLQPRRIGGIVNRMLLEEEPFIREIAAWLLGFVGGAASRAALQNALARDKCAAVRAQAAESLGTRGEKRSLKPLIAALCQRSSRVRYSAAYALGELGDAGAAPALRELLTDRSRVYGSTVATQARSALRRLRTVA